MVVSYSAYKSFQYNNTRHDTGKSPGERQLFNLPELCRCVNEN
jgi:hypothetical protein